MCGGCSCRPHRVRDGRSREPGPSQQAGSGRPPASRPAMRRSWVVSDRRLAARPRDVLTPTLRRHDRRLRRPRLSLQERRRRISAAARSAARKSIAAARRWPWRKRPAVCSATAQRPVAGRRQGLLDHLRGRGATCASAEMTFTVRRPDWLPIGPWRPSSRMFQVVQCAEDLHVLAGCTPKTGMGSIFRPAARSDPRLASRQVTREQWNAWRAAKLPTLDFTFGIETVHLYVLDGRRCLPQGRGLISRLIRASACAGGSA